jgi:basic membrane protein A
MKRTSFNRSTATLSVIALAALLIAACGSSSKSSTSSAGGASAPSTHAVKMALVLPCGSSDPWCDQGYKAAQQLKAQGVVDLKVTLNAPQDTAGASQVIRQYAQAGEQLVVAYSTWSDATNLVATQFPKVNFATFGFKPLRNVADFDEPIYQAAYLAGMVAGGITKSNVISGVAGQDVPLCHAEMQAFEAGAKAVNPKVKQLTSYGPCLRRRASERHGAGG